MRKLVSALTTGFVLLLTLPICAAFAEENPPLSFSDTITVMAEDYTESFDKSTGSSAIIVENHKVSFSAGDFVTYDLTAAASGSYALSLTSASGSPSSGKVEVYINGVLQSACEIGATGDWGTYQKSNLGNVELRTGNNTVEFRHISGDAFYFYSFDLNLVTADETESTQEIIVQANETEELGIPRNSRITYEMILETAGRFRIFVETAGMTGEKLTFSLNNSPVCVYTMPKSDEWAAVCDLYIRSGTNRIVLLNLTEMFNPPKLRLVKIEQNSRSSEIVLSKNAADYDASYDADKDSNHIAVENGNVSFNPDDWISFQVTSTQAGIYRLRLTTASANQDPSKLCVMWNDEEKGRISVAGTGGWGNFDETSAVIYLPAGNGTLKLQHIGTNAMYFKALTLETGDAPLHIVEGWEYFDENKQLSASEKAERLIYTERSDIFRITSFVSGKGQGELLVNGISCDTFSAEEGANTVMTTLNSGINHVIWNGQEGEFQLSASEICRIEDEETVDQAAHLVSSAVTAETAERLLRQEAETLRLDVEGMSEQLILSMPLFAQAAGRYAETAEGFYRFFIPAAWREKVNPSLTISNTETNGQRIRLRTPIGNENGVAVVAFYKGNQLSGICSAAFAGGETVQMNLDHILYDNTINNVKAIYLNDFNELKPYSMYREEPIDIYVSANGDDLGDGSKQMPFRSLSKAKEAVAARGNNVRGKITIHLASGVYDLADTELFEAAHGGKNGYQVIIRGDDENPPIISGGDKITDWMQLENGLYQAHYSGNSDIRNLFVNGYPAVRARSKYKYEFEKQGANDEIVLSSVDFPPSFAKPECMELVWDLQWECQRTPVTDIKYDTESKTATFKMKQPFFSYSSGTSGTSIHKGNMFYIENAYELLDEPGEFFYDSENQMIYYYPRADENMATAEIYTDRLNGLITVAGTREQPVENLIFENIEFRYGGWDAVNTNGFMGIQSDVYMTNATSRDTIPAQFTVNHARGVSIRNCRFSCLGSTALKMEENVTNSAVTGNVIRDISGAGISIGSYFHNGNYRDRQPCRRIRIENNVIRRIGIEYRSCVGIGAFYENELEIRNNDIASLPYSGISIGWGWGEDAPSGNIQITENKITNVLKVMADGGMIYTLGPLRNSEISKNYLKKTGCFRGAIYTDSGSAYLSIRNNVIEEAVNWWSMGLFKTHDMTAENNFADTPNYEAHGTNNRMGKFTEIGSDVYPQEADAVVNAAGLKDQFDALTELAELPDGRECPFEALPQHGYFRSDEQWTEAEDFMPGGEGVGYHKNKPLYKNNLYRPEDGVGLLKNPQSGFGYVVDRDYHGEWLAYQIHIEQEGTYYFDIKAGMGDVNARPKLSVYVDGTLAIAKESVPATENWSDMAVSELGKVALSKGTHTIRIEFVDAGIYLDAFRLREQNKSMIPVETDICFDDGKMADRA